MSDQNWNGMWTDPANDPRENSGESPDEGSGDGASGEKAVLLEYLERYRTTLQMKCDGLDAEQMARRSVPPSTMSLLGMVRHLAKVEHHWFRRILEGQPHLGQLYASAVDKDYVFNGAVPDDGIVSEAWQSWHREVAHAREVQAGLDMDGHVESRGDQLEVRDILVHMVEEYARHMGHVDLLRECIDGRTGQ